MGDVHYAYIFFSNVCNYVAFGNSFSQVYFLCSGLEKALSSPYTFFRDNQFWTKICVWTKRFDVKKNDFDLVREY